MAPELFRFFLRELSKHMDLRLLIDFARRPMPLVMRRDLEVAVIRLAGVYRACIHDWPEFKRFRRHPISACWAVLYAPDKYRPIIFSTYDSSLDVKAHPEPSKDQTERYLHGLFFCAVAKCLELRGAPLVGEEPEYSSRPWLSTAAKHMLSIANSVGGLLARGEIPSFALPYRLVDSVLPPKDYEFFGDYVAFRRALLTVAHDVFLLGALRSGLTEIPLIEWRRASTSRHFLFSEWLERYVASGQRLVAAEAIERTLQTALQKTTERVSPFNERAQEFLELCELALHQRLDTFAAEALRRTLNCVIGYGWRKDGTMSHVLDAITAVPPVST